MANPVITLTSDLGTKEYYIPSVKGYLASHIPAANIVDITHEIPVFNIADAAYIVMGCFADFPEGTVHIISVDSDRVMEPRFIMAKARGHYFATFDNGLISLITESVDEFVELPFEKDDLIFPMKKILAPATAKLLKAGKLSDLGSPAKDYRRLAYLQPVIEQDIIRGTVIYIDNYGNAITNISRDDIKRVANGRSHKIYTRRNEYFTKISENYNDVPEGERLCLIGSNGLLEIAINKGNGSGLLGLNLGHGILIEFI